MSSEVQMCYESSLRIIILWMMNPNKCVVSNTANFLFHYKVSELESLKKMWVNIFMDTFKIAHGTFVFPREIFKKSLTGNVKLEITIYWMRFK
jgi:hypothetical protein